MGGTGEWKRDWVIARVDFRLVRAVSMMGGPSALPGEKEIQEGAEKTFTDKQQARALDRLCAFIAHIFRHVRHGL